MSSTETLSHLLHAMRQGDKLVEILLHGRHGSPFEGMNASGGFGEPVSERLASECVAGRVRKNKQGVKARTLCAFFVREHSPGDM
jgi:hypothetical protein